MSYPMSKSEILKAVALYNECMPIDRISAAIGRDRNCVSKHIRNYRIYGDSYFTDYPQRIDKANN